MGDDDEKPIILCREDLYELAWSKPMSELAKDFGISDVALAKRFRRLGIPVPGRGYWTRLDAGQTPYRPKLPKREPQWHDESALTVAPSPDTPIHMSGMRLDEAAQHGESGDSIPARIAALVLPSTPSVLDTLPPVKRTAVRLKHPRRFELTFERGQKSGIIVAIQVTPGALDRALLLADNLLRAAEALGWTYEDPAALRGKAKVSLSDSESEGWRRSQEDSTVANTKATPEPRVGRLRVDDEEITFQIEERFRDEPRNPTAAELAREKREYRYHAPRSIAVATGALRLARGQRL